MRSNSISFAPEIIDFHEATLFSNFCLCERRAPPRVDVARFQEMTKVSLTSFGRSCTTRRTLEAIAVRSRRTPYCDGFECAACCAGSPEAGQADLRHLLEPGHIDARRRSSLTETEV